MKRPAMAYGISYVAGVLSRQYLNGHYLVVFVSVVILFVSFRMKFNYWRYLLGICLIGLIGYMNMDMHQHKIEIQNQVIQLEQPVETVGYVLQKDDSNKLVCQLMFITQGKLHQKTRIKILVYNKQNNPIEVGDAIKIMGTLNGFTKATNPGGFDAQSYYYTKGISYSMFPKDMTVINRKKFDINREFHNFRKKLELALRSIFPEKEASILGTMLLGARTLDEDTKQLYQLAGISHLLAISGLHFTIIGMGIFQLLKAIIKNIKLSAAISIIVLILYCLLSGCTASSIRATIMCILMLLTVFFSESYDAISALFISAIAILLFNPYQLMDIGFILSFSAVVGILWITPLLEERYNPKNKCIANLLFVSLGASLTTLPIIAFYFYRVPLYALMINVLVVPIASLIIGMSIIALSASAISMPLAKILGGSVYFALNYIEMCCKAASFLPLNSLSIGKPRFLEVVLYYILLVLIFYNPFKAYWQKLKIGCYLFICIYIILRLIPNHQLEIAFLDVGQGDSAVLEYDRRIYLIDGGGQLKTSKSSKSSNKNTGSYVLKPYLAAKGYQHLDGIFISHSDYDHIYGIIEVIKEIETDFIVLPLPYKTHPDALVKELLFEAEKHHIKVHYFSEGDNFTYKDLNIHCIFPYEETTFDKNNNCNSMVLKVNFKAFNGLFTGDIESPQENAILQKSQKEVEVIKVAHHGSDTSSTQSFLSRFSPEAAVFSYGKNNFYGHPSEAVVESYHRQGVVSYHIAQKGAVLLKTNGETFCIQAYLSNRKDKYICNN